MLRRSDFMDAMYAFSFVLANFGIAIAARMPMMTTTIRSSISVKPFLLDMCIAESPCWWLLPGPQQDLDAGSPLRCCSLRRRSAPGPVTRRAGPPRARERALRWRSVVLLRIPPLPHAHRQAYARPA